MAQCRLTPQEFIKSAFAPQIAVMCSPSAEQLCGKNNLRFTELVQPFCRLTADAYLQEPSGDMFTVRNLKITLKDVNFHPPSPAVTLKLLNSAVKEAPEPRFIEMKVGKVLLSVPATVPWFDAWREVFLQIQYPSDHEFTKHFLGCIFVISSNDTIDTLNQMNQTLNQLQNTIPNKLPKWFCSNILRYHVLVHDNIVGNNDTMNECLESMRAAFGNENCFLLRINSLPPDQSNEMLPDPWTQFVYNFVGNNFKNSQSNEDLSKVVLNNSDLTESGDHLPYHPLSPEAEDQPLNESLEKDVNKSVVHIAHGMCLSTEDVEQIKLFIHEFCTRALIPFVERLISRLTEMVSNRKGVSKSLLTATKRWFTLKPGTNNLSVNTLVYTSNAPELQLRKLGDLYFMFYHYSMAFQIFHDLKRDFNADQAWLYYAGALEMSGLAAFLAAEASRKTNNYLEESIKTYLSVCKMPQLATRATLLSSECLKGRNWHGEAAHQLIRMTSEESDLRSALFLEQAAYCFLNSTSPKMLRKYAFHMVLAGHRFSKAAQKEQALRSYKQAVQVYKGKNWTFAADHVYYTIGKLASNSDKLEESAEAFSTLLTICSKQSIQQQNMFLKEFITIQKKFIKFEKDNELPILPLPVLHSNTLKILVEPTPPLTIPGKVPAIGVSFVTKDDSVATHKWNKLEEMIVQEVQGNLPLIFKPVVTLFRKDNLNTITPTAILNEPVHISISVSNPLSIILNLKDIFLSWTFINTREEQETNCQKISGTGTETSVLTHVIKNITLESNSSHELILSLVPLAVGKLYVNGIFYKIFHSNAIDLDLSVAGKQTFDLTQLKLAKKQVNEALEIDIKPPAPCLQVCFSELNPEMLCDQIEMVTMELRNVGSVPLNKVCIATSAPELLSFHEFRKEKHAYVRVEGLDMLAVKEREARKNHVINVSLPKDKLEPGQCHTVCLWIKAPSVKGLVTVDLLIYYENSFSKEMPKYRLTRHFWNLTISESIKIVPSLHEGFESSGNNILGLSIKVINSWYNTFVTEMLIKRAAFVSRFWELKDITVTPTVIPFGSQKCLYLLYTLSRRVSDSSKYYESEPLVAYDENDERQSKAAYREFSTRLEHFCVNIFDDRLPTSDVDLQGVIVLQWQASITSNSGQVREIKGQSALPIDEQVFALFDNKISTGRLEQTSAEVGKKLLSYAVIHANYISHDFCKNGPCILPIELVVHSHRTDNSSITIRANNKCKSENSPEERCGSTNLYSFSAVKWLGPTFIQEQIEALNKKVIGLTVAIFSPGIFDIGGLLEVYCEDQLQNCSIESALIVSASAS